MTLQQQAVKEISLLSEEDLSQVIQFMNYLRFCKSNNSMVVEDTIEGKKYRTRGGLAGKVVRKERICIFKYCVSLGNSNKKVN